MASVIEICDEMGRRGNASERNWATCIRSAYLREVAKYARQLSDANAEVARMKFECHKCFENGETRHAREVVK